jgi:outer membrane autotransporter protein
MTTTTFRWAARCLGSATLWLAAATQAQAQVLCTPSVSPSPLVANQVATLNGNCVPAPGAPNADGSEVWSVPNGQGGTVTLTRLNGAPPLTLSFANPGTQNLSLVHQGSGGITSGPFAVQVTVQSTTGAAGTRFTSAATPQQLAAIAAVRTQLSTVVTRMRTLRTQPGTPAVSATLSTSQGAVSTSSDDKRNDPGQGESGSDAKKELSADATQTGRLGVFIAGGLENARQEASAAGPGFRTQTTGATAGADYRMSKSWILGAGLAVLDTDTKFSTGSGRQFAKGRSATLYTSFMPTREWYVDLAYSVDRSRYELKRDDVVGDAAFARTQGKGQGLTLSTGYDWRRGAWLLLPYARAEMIDVRIRAFEEFGSLNSLQVGEQKVKSGNFTLGGQLQYVMSSRWGLWMPYARLEATRTFEDSSQPVQVRLLGSSTAVLLDDSAVLRDQSFGNAAIGVSAQLQRGLSLFADAEVGFGQTGYRPWRLNSGMKVEF